MKEKSPSRLLLSACLCFLVAATAIGQVAVVTVQLDTNRVAIGEITTLHVFAQIASAQRTNADRIFSWYVDLLNDNGAVAKLKGDELVKPSSDKDPPTSSPGTIDGGNWRGIYDTFINLAGAGTDTPVELFSVPAQGVAPGKTTFNVQAGSGVPGLAADFIVAPLGNGDALIGGDYSAASIALEVIGPGTPPKLNINVVALPLNQGQTVTLTFATTAGLDYFIEYRDSLSADAIWLTLPNGPHNSGMVSNISTARSRFYRLRVGN